MLTLFDGTGAVLTFQSSLVNNLINITFVATTTEVRAQMNTYASSVCGSSGTYCHYYGLRCTSCAGPGAPACPTLSSPANLATGVSILPTLSWAAATNAVSYDVYLDADPTCSATPSTLIATVSTTSYTFVSSLSPSTQYRWTVIPKDCAGIAPASCSAFCFTTSVAPPANDNCTGTNGTPVSLTPQPNAASCSSPVAATTVGATQSNTNCSTTATNDDVWFTFTANATSEIVRFENVVTASGTVTAMGMDLYTTCGGTNTNCNTALTLVSGNVQGTLTGLTAGVTYFLRVWTTGVSNSATFNICVIDPPPPPANDDCSGASVLTTSSGWPCTATALSWASATASAGVPAPGCASYTAGTTPDVWFSFTLATDASVFINTTAGTGTGAITDGGMALYSGTCGALALVECDDDDAAGNMPQIRKFLTAGTYYIRFWEYGGTSGDRNIGGICVNQTTPLANDNCSGVNGTPVVLTPQSFAAACSSPVSATTVGATQSNTDCTPTGTFAADDVWFQFTTGAGITSQTIRFENVMAAFGPAVTAISFNTYTACGGVSANCTSVTLTAGAGQATITGLTAATTYYLRVYTNGSTEDAATFNICIIDPQPMTYVSSAITQQTGTVGAGSTYQKILQLNVVTINLLNPLTVTQLDFSTAGTPGTSIPADLTNARVYYTGTTSTWTDGTPSGTQFGATVVNPSGAMTFTGSQALTGGVANTNNYFWLVYDLACAAAGPNIDASMVANGLTITGGSYTPTTPDPASNRTVTALASYTTTANGNWSNPATWSCGVPPNGTTATININHNVTLDVNVNVQSTFTVAATKTFTVAANTVTIGGAGTGTQNLVINGTVAVSGGTLNVGTSSTTPAVTTGNVTFSSGGILNVSAGTLNVGTGLIANVTTSNILVTAGASLIASGGTINLGPTGGYSRTLSSIGGTTTFSGATVNVNGNVSIGTGGTFNMSAGTMTIDGNGAASVALGTNLLTFGSSTASTVVNGTGGTIIIVDPHATNSPTGGRAVGMSFSSSNVGTASLAGTTIQFGDGVSTTAGNPSGFIFDTYLGGKNVPLGPVIVNAGNGATRFLAGSGVTTNAADIFGSLTVNAGCEVRSSSSSGIGVYGNIINNGTISITSASSGILFLGGRQVGTPPVANIAQTISGSGIWRNNISTASATASINSVTMLNGAGTTLQVPLSVGNTLTLTSGKIFTDATNYLAVGTGLLPAGGLNTIGTGTISGGSTTSHIVGPIYRTVGSATWLVSDQRGLFPVGDGTNYRPINVAVTTVPSTLGPLSGEYKISDPGVPAAPYTDGGINIETTSSTGFWNVSYAASGILPLNMTAGGVYSVQCNANGFTKRLTGAIAAGDIPNLRLIKRPTNGSWVAGADGTPTAPTVLTAITRTGCTTFSDFAIGGTLVALPIELKSFTGKTLDISNMLYWTTASEKNLQWHVIERSANGFDGWTTVGEKASQGDAATDQQYSIEDRSPLAKGFYRLRSVDLDGREQTSGVIALIRKGDQAGIVSVFPNPATDVLNVQLSASEEGTVTVQIVDFTGRLVKQQFANVQKGINAISIELSQLSAGTYTVNMINGTTVAEPVRFVKQ
jgi:hypothetical protein